MSFSIPIYHWFHNGNPYSGAEGGMRFIITPGKRPDPADETGKKKVEYLTATVWARAVEPGAHSGRKKAAGRF